MLFKIKYSTFFDQNLRRRFGFDVEIINQMAIDFLVS